MEVKEAVELRRRGAGGGEVGRASEEGPRDEEGEEEERAGGARDEGVPVQVFSGGWKRSCLRSERVRGDMVKGG